MFNSILAWLGILLLFTGLPLTAETVTVRSGNGTVGGRDASVTFLLGPAIGDFTHTLTATDFSSAQSGPAAYIIRPNPLWITGLSEDPSAKWIGTNANAASSGNTALYAISFRLTAAFSTATLTLHYASDDTPSFNGGILLNGTVICQNAIEVGFSQDHTLTCNVGPLLQIGTNWLYFNIANVAAAGITQDPAGLLFSATITMINSPVISAGGIVNAASSVPGPVAPGALVSVYGGFPVNSPAQASTVPWPITLSGLSFQFTGIPAPLYYVSPSMADLQIPWELVGSNQASVVATAGTQTSAPQIVNLAPFSPGIFSMNAQGTGQGAILDSQYRLVDSSNPASVEDIIQIYCTGLGPVSNQPPSGSPAPTSPLAETTNVPTVMIGGSPAQVWFSGLTPGSVGLYQINVKIPTGIATGPSVPVSVLIGAGTSNTVTVGVQPFPPNPNPLPSITGLSPSSAVVGTNSLTLLIAGNGFAQSSSVKFNGVAHQASFVSGSQLTMLLSGSDLATIGTFPIVVTNPPPGGGKSNAVNFTVSAALNAVPSITSLAPSSAGAGAGPITLNINGSGFSAISTVTFNGVLHDILAAKDNLLVITLSKSDLALAGAFAVVVTNPAPGGGKATTTFNVVQDISIAGHWQGTWSPTIGGSGSMSATFTQTGSLLGGTVSVTNSRCFTTAGTVTTGSTVSGANIVLNVVFGGLRMVVNDGQTNGRGQIIGHYSVQGTSIPSLCVSEGLAGGIALTEN